MKAKKDLDKISSVEAGINENYFDEFVH